MTPDLYRRSIEIIRQYQEPNGAYVACPSFEQYRYCWLRDGTFIANAMDCTGQHDSSARFYAWVDTALRGQADRIEEALARVASGLRIDPARMPPTRFRLDGTPADDDWPNFQLDGYGAWLWGLAEHIRFTGERGLLHRCETSIDLTIRYLKACWHLPNYDCWEERSDLVHPSTLAALYGGLTAINQYLCRKDLTETAAALRAFLLEQGVKHGRFVKSIGLENVDASLLWLAIPFGVVASADPRMVATVDEIERLLHHGGVHRYSEDTYYGGGEWLLLASWLGWYYCDTGRLEEAVKIKKWVETCATEGGELPEQVSGHLNAPDFYDGWRRRWGRAAVPLLWSHAMYLVLSETLAATIAHPSLMAIQAGNDSQCQGEVGTETTA